MPSTVVVTGASGGVGRALVRRLGADGHRVGLIARGHAGLAAAAAEVEAAGGVALAVPCDVADADAVEAAAARFEAELGPIDAWVNCAMVSVQARAIDTTAAELRRITEVTYLGGAHGIRSALDRMVPRDRGHVVQVGSVLAYRGAPLQAGYAGAKHALRGFCDAVRAELRDDDSAVLLTLVHPAGANTTHFGWTRARTRGAPRPFPPAVQPEVVARAIHWTLRHPSPRRPSVPVDLPTVLAIALGRLELPVYGPVLGRLIARGLQRRRPPEGGPDALFAPVDDGRDHGARGPFSAESRAHAPEFVLLRHGRGLTVAAVVGALVRRGIRRR